MPTENFEALQNVTYKGVEYKAGDEINRRCIPHYFKVVDVAAGKIRRMTSNPMSPVKKAKKEEKPEKPDKDES